MTAKRLRGEEEKDKMHFVVPGNTPLNAHFEKIMSESIRKTVDSVYRANHIAENKDAWRAAFEAEFSDAWREWYIQQNKEKWSKDYCEKNAEAWMIQYMEVVGKEQFDAAKGAYLTAAQKELNQLKTNHERVKANEEQKLAEEVQSMRTRCAQTIKKEQEVVRTAAEKKVREDLEAERIKQTADLGKQYETSVSNIVTHITQQREMQEAALKREMDERRIKAMVYVDTEVQATKDELMQTIKLLHESEKKKVEKELEEEKKQGKKRILEEMETEKKRMVVVLNNFAANKNSVEKELAEQREQGMKRVREEIEMEKAKMVAELKSKLEGALTHAKLPQKTKGGDEKTK